MYREKIIYSINIEDLQNVADQELARELTEDELKILENKLGDYIDWYGSIATALDDIIR
ncbi:MAG: hypothetical protein KAU17_11020 [Spirochaetales bacterium]|jgi:hypothetical protein|nr:hypothetical protein [Spirochaetales bacterium]